MSSIAVIQARIGSSRLPRKVLTGLAGQAVLAWVVRAARAVPGIDDVVVATTEEAGDNDVAAWCQENGVVCVRGSTNDVLARFIAALDRFPDADTIMRLTADCPLLDPHVCGQVLALFKQEGCAYASNVHPATWPDGLDCEVMSAVALRTAHGAATRPSEREHVTPFISSNGQMFKARTLISPLPNIAVHRWTLDTPEDLELIQALAARLPSRDRAPAFTEILNVLAKQPDLADINRLRTRDESFVADLSAEAAPPHHGYKRSQELLAAALRIIPLGGQTFSKSYIQYPKAAAPLFAARGRGGRIWDVDGNEYVDLVCSLLCVNLGYNDPDVDAAVREQLTRGVTFSLNTELEARLARLVIEMVPSAEQVRFAKNGTDVTSAAVRLSRAVTGRARVGFCGYHGWQDWYVGATSMHRGVPQAVRDLTHHIPYNDLPTLQTQLAARPGEFACVVMEPLSGDGPVGSYLKDACEVIRGHGALVVFDEVISGFRIAAGGAQDYYGVTPDLTALGKGIANGLPLSVLAGRAEYMKDLERVFFSGTFGGETLSLAAGIAVLEKIKREPVIKHLWTVGKRLADIAKARIAEHKLEHVLSVKGLAPWSTLSMNSQPSGDADMIYSYFVREMARHGVLTQGSHNVCYAHGEEDIAWVDTAYAAMCGGLARHLADGTLASDVGDQVVRPLFKVRVN
jgi:glutamate-1-semialdehyde 2,1-aminomutase